MSLNPPYGRSHKALYLFFILFVAITTSISILNYTIDPLCYYHCNTIDTNRKTLNTYYQVAQKLIERNDIELLVIGSSRAQVFSPQWLEQKSHLKTFNASVSGGALHAKIALLNIAIQYNSIKQVLWFVDYFDFLELPVEEKIQLSPPLLGQLPPNLSTRDLSSTFLKIRLLIDHNLIEASTAILLNKIPTISRYGYGADIPVERITSSEYKSSISEKKLMADLHTDYQRYSNNIFTYPYSNLLYQSFEKQIADLHKKNIKVKIVITPYHPEMTSLLTKYNGKIMQEHEQWVLKLKAQFPDSVYDFYDYIPNTKATSNYWNDGVHFNAKSAIEIINQIFP